MPPKSTKALEKAILALFDGLFDIHTSLELRYETLVAVVTNIQHQLAFFPPAPVLPSPAFAISTSIPPLPPSSLLPTSPKPPKLHLPPFDGEALSWFKWMFTNQQLSTWDAFLRSLELRFDPSSYANPQAALFKLWQRGSVFDFRLSLNVFAIGLTKVLESKTLDARPVRHAAPLAFPRAPERRAQGLYFNCDEKFGPGHHCKAKQFLLVMAEDSELPEPPESATIDPLPPPPPQFLTLDCPEEGLHFQLSSVAAVGLALLAHCAYGGRIHEHIVTVFG
ncbi:UNVERIFIED_CONTAM: hypothetical protein Sradi_6815800 [Sesamum radiatum]|uniref:Retrotransposon gag domain-containing protein n=1 Tax=Sesamum radiatum TaxID=300843 RepID=A0AAW2JUQ1_SESRA